MVERRDVFAVGASAGGVEALRMMAAGLPSDFAGSILVVLHIPRSSPSALPAILNRSGPLHAAAARDGEHLERGRIYVAPHDHHMLVLDGRIRLTRGPAENGHRPAIDPLFRSVARAVGRRAVGVVLSGTRDDGAAGMLSITRRGGIAVTQDPDDALYPQMPRAALAATAVAHVVPAAKLGGVLTEITAMDLPDLPAPADDELLNAEVAMSELGPLTADDLAVPAAGYGCPSCGGSLFEMTDDPMPRYRCRVGHAWSPESLLEEQAVALEGALWMALRALEEKSALSRRMASSTDRNLVTRSRYQDLAADADAAGDAIRALIDRLGSAVTGPER